MTLWTPDGERPINRDPAEAPAAAQPNESAETQPTEAGLPVDDMTPEEQAQVAAMAKEMAEARARLLETDAATVMANHALGIYELGAIHLTADEPDFDEAKLAIDGLAVLVEGLAGRLGEAEPTLKEALHQIRMAFVQRSNEDQKSSGA